MIKISISGGLGNQMFQYAFGRAKALKNDADLALIPSYKAKNTAPRGFLLNNFNIKADIRNSTSIKEKIFKIAEPHPPFSKEIYEKPKGYFVGNWQSEKYFKDYEDKIRADFTLKNRLSSEAEKIKDLIEKSYSVSLHVRRGDYASDQRVNEKHGLATIEYYSKAIYYIKEKVSQPTLFVFSDDIKWARENLPLTESAVFVSNENISECEDLVLMSLCKNNIIANSTFSWWGAWLNKNQNKIVIAPRLWFGRESDTSYLIPQEWLRM